MSSFAFTIIASGLDTEADDFEQRFFDAGCDDATISVQKGAIVLEFTREARNFAHALVSAVRAVYTTGAKVEHIEPDYLVSLSEIAVRADVSKAAISLYAKGLRGAGFPAPVARITTESPLWDWFEVARWMYKKRSLSLSAVVEARMVRDANFALIHPEGFEGFFSKKFREQLAA